MNRQLLIILFLDKGINLSHLLGSYSTYLLENLEYITRAERSLLDTKSFKPYFLQLLEVSI